MRKTFLAVLALSFFAAYAAAMDRIPESSGFHGYFEPGGGYLNVKTNMFSKVWSFDVSHKRGNGLDAVPHSKESGTYSLPVELSYVNGQTGTQYFMKSSDPDLMSFVYAPEAGIRQKVGDYGRIELAGFYSDGLVRTWEDPYMMDAKRKKTDIAYSGAKFGWDQIFGTGLEFNYKYTNVDIDEERSGLSAGVDASRLERDGNNHAFTAAYNFVYGCQKIVPSFTYTYSDLDGEAMSGDIYDGKIAYILNSDAFSFKLEGLVGHEDFDGKNPVFDKTRNDERYAVSTEIYIGLPKDLAVANTSANFYVKASWNDIDSNIDFYDQQAIASTAGISFSW